MERIGWHDLATATQGRLVPAGVWGACERISTDSRDIQPGDVFWALPGVKFDGHDFATNAVQQGAKLVVCRSDRSAGIPGSRLVVDDPLKALSRLAAWYRKRLETLIIGVTGSVGKSTTKELLFAALSPQFTGLRSPASFNNAVGLPKSLLAIEPDHEFAVLELGASRRGEIRDLAAVAQPEIGVITAIAKAHLETFGGMEGVIAAKGELLAALPETGFAVLPGDDPVTRGMASRARCRVLFVGEGADNDLRGEDVIAGADLRFVADGESFRVPIAGRQHLTNALLAIAVAREVGVPLDLVADGLSTFQPLPGRCRTLTAGPWTVIDDCYNASPLAVEAACRLLAGPTWPLAARRYLVLGDMRELGATAADEHRAIGRLCGELGLAGVLAFGDHATDVAAGANRSGLPPGRLVATRSLDVLLAVLDCWLEPGDVVLVKGSRAMQMERVVDWLQSRAAAGTEQRRCA
ncbi:MAG TPA: UDP-N-acetylmuramoyl-tripeptide--D-alanyl-D-alanine ligase [Planctomycetaceae bacterium]|nr:UDP-N-acetylmuramoyl-tripeptide--D-alanyl-D-alanine ligase [Planctomycetaceae bacterium]